MLKKKMSGNFVGKRGREEKRIGEGRGGEAFQQKREREREGVCVCLPEGERHASSCAILFEKVWNSGVDAHGIGAKGSVRKNPQISVKNMGSV